MKKYLLLLLLTLPLIGFGQIPNWQWAKNYGLYFNGGKQYTAVDNVGNVYLAGDFGTQNMTVGNTTLVNTTTNFADIYIIKFDSNGNVLWAKSIGGVDHEFLSGITTDTFGNFYISGSYTYSITLGSTTLTSSGSANFFAKYDSNGNAIWAKSDDQSSFGWGVSDLKVDEFGNIYIAGVYAMPQLVFNGITVTYENYVTGQSNGARIWTGKFDNLGNCIWLRSAQSSIVNLYGNHPNSIAVDKSGNVFIGGRFHNGTINFGAITLTKTATYDYNSNMFLIKYNSSGIEQWGVNTGTTYSNLTYVNTVCTDANNNVFVSGFFPNTINFGSITLSAGGGSKSFTAKFDPAGNVLWAKSVDAEVCGTSTNSSDVDADGNLYITGYTQCPLLDFGNGISLSMASQGGLFVAKYNPDGNAVWARRSGGTNPNNISTIDCKNENEIFIAGTFFSPTLVLGNLTLTKTATNYNLFIAKLNYTPPLSNDDFGNDSFSAYPNPVKTTLHFSNLEVPCNYSLNDISGKQILKGTFQNENETLSTENLNLGVYLLRMENEKGEIEVKKIVKI